MFEKRHNVPYNLYKVIAMNSLRKKKLLMYLYPTRELADFMINDVYVELSFFLDKKVCFSKNNTNEKVREENAKQAHLIIQNFLNNNPMYIQKLETFYSKNKSQMISDILWGYTMMVSSNINRWTGADIFWDKRSVCYCRHSVFDFDK